MLSDDAVHGVDPSLNNDTALSDDAMLSDEATLSNYTSLGGNVSCTFYYAHCLKAHHHDTKQHVAKLCNGAHCHEAHHHDTKQHVTKLCNMYHDGDI